MYVNVDFQIELGEEWSQKSIETWNIECIDASVIIRSSDKKNMHWARIIYTWKSMKNQRALPLDLDDERV
jgi:hypothetical protein